MRKPRTVMKRAIVGGTELEVRIYDVAGVGQDV